MDIVNHHQQEREIFVRWWDKELRGGGNYGHLAPWVGHVGGAVGVAGKDEAKDVGMRSEGFRKGSSHS